MQYYLLLLAAVITLGAWFYRKVRYWRYEQYADFPRLPPSLFWGHLKALGEEMATLPKMKHIDYAFESLAQKAGNPPLLAMDMRPINYNVCIIRDQFVAEQISRATKQHAYSQPKSPTMTELTPVTGHHSIIVVNGEKWKNLRKQFNAGFAPQHLVTLLPRILDKTKIFMDILDDIVRSGEVVQINKLTTYLTFDIIGAVVLDADLDAQTEHKHEVVTSFLTLMDSYSDDGFQWAAVSPALWWRRRQATKTLNRAVTALIHNNFERAKEAQRLGKKSTKGRSVLALSLQDTEKLDPQTTEVVAHQIQSFLFAGHDTTAIVLAWTFYELERHPKIAAKLRAELDTVLGRDASPDAVIATLRDQGDDAIRRLTYTSAVIKEILRLHPPAGTARMPVPSEDFIVQLPDGRSINMAGCVCYIAASLVHRDEKAYGPTANDFIPERWLESGDVSTTSEEYAGEDSKQASSEKAIPPGAWRPFERGPRNCIGQELANIEARVILACAVRRYDFHKVGAGALEKDGRGRPVFEDGKDRYKTESELYNVGRSSPSRAGEANKSMQMRQVTSKPFDMMEMRVTLHQD